MHDLLYLAMTVAFFALCVAYVRGLDRIVGEAEEPEAGPEVTS